MNIDFNKIDNLAMTKSYSMLTIDEKAFIAQHFDGELEYENYRNFIGIIPEKLSDDFTPKPDEGIELRVIEHMKMMGSGSNQVIPKRQSIFSSIAFLFSSHALGLKTSIAAIFIMGVTFFNWQDQINHHVDPQNSNTLIADSSFEAFQDSNTHKLDSFYIKSSL